MEIRQLGPGDEDAVIALATREPRTELLHNDHTIFLAAFDGDDPVGLLLAYEYPRRHGLAKGLLVYEVDVAETHRRRGIASALFDEVEQIARSREIDEGWVLTDKDNVAANALYASRGGVAQEVVEWDFNYADD
jgi:aminoglycoside 3-N-acetyltransferase I